MRILFDHSTPAPLRHYLKEHSVTEARDRGWDRLANGDLLKTAEEARFEALITADRNIRYQQNLAGRASPSLNSVRRAGGQFDCRLTWFSQR